MSDDIKKLKKIIDSSESLKEKFGNVKSLTQAVELAKSYGCNITEDDILNDEELAEERLMVVAGGKENSQAQAINVSDVAVGKGSGIYRGGTFGKCYYE